ncbi:hypothetical protein CLV84_0703 [Neolewinella xylanilytica]|uniref:Uncharacterized protein n=1 Tax=Neolewinella xylanilytica TaxID=1514080 RepID=A0A2S6I8E6_9BACT|nr:hypothetical protein CLV84_0703 [Neolewinella xylanilytica]
MKTKRRDLFSLNHLNASKVIDLDYLHFYMKWALESQGIMVHISQSMSMLPNGASLFILTKLICV